MASFQKIGRSTLERFATPHTFNPALSLSEALVAVAVAFTRIFLGSLLFAIYGVYAFVAWIAIKSFFWRASASRPSRARSKSNTLPAAQA